MEFASADSFRSYIGEVGSLQPWIKHNQINILLFLAFLVIATRQLLGSKSTRKEAGRRQDWLNSPGFPEPERLLDFRWQDEEPQKFRPFKPTYHLTMALQNLDPSELILMDKNYADRITYRKQIMVANPDLAIGVNDHLRIGPAVRELYTYLLGTYLPKRYPGMFKLHFAQFETGKQWMCENLVTKEVYPVATSATSEVRILLLTLGKTIDEDFLFLLPEQDGDDPKYVLQAFVTCCPSGFDSSQKLGLRLADIHEPVPGYADKIAGSMDKYFKNLQAGKYVKRANWAVTTHGELFVPGTGKLANHAKKGEEITPMQEIDPAETFLRVERQTLHRLPTSEAVVFAFKTYLYSIKDIKTEGLGEDLAQAIDGMRSGSVPDMHFYKRAAVWGEAVKTYLRSTP